MAIAGELTEQGIPTIHGNDVWHSRTILDILKNEWYIGNIRYQKTCATGTLPHRQVRNRGQADQYYAENTHPSIVSRQCFAKVQEMRKDRTVVKPGKQYPLSMKVYCAKYGASYKREQHREQIAWVYRSRRIRTGSCSGAWIPEEKIYNAFVTMHNKLWIYYTDSIPLRVTNSHSRKHRKYVVSEFFFYTENRLCPLFVICSGQLCFKLCYPAEES